MHIFSDQTGRSIQLEKTPERIISIVPSQTELLYDLGLDKEVVGISKFCVHPESWFKTKTRVGGTKQLKMEIIHKLRPDLILANKEENVKEQVEELEKHYPVWISDVKTMHDARYMIQGVGKITGKERKASDLIIQIDDAFSKLEIPDPRPKAAYLIWQNPFMTAGGDTFIHDMMETAGFENIFSDRLRYPEISLEQLSIAHCQLLLLSSEPFPFKQNHINELQPYLPDKKIILVDGEMFSWYGSRLLKAPFYFQKLQQQVFDR